MLSSGVDTKFSLLLAKFKVHEKKIQNNLLYRCELVEEIISDAIQEERRISDRKQNFYVFNMRHANDDARKFSALCSQQLGLNKL